jgi:hypothetical protein
MVVCGIARVVRLSQVAAERSGAANRKKRVRAMSR